MADIALSIGGIGGIGAVIPGSAVSLQIDPVGAQDAAAAPATDAAATGMNVVVNVSDAAWRALALEAAAVGGATAISTKALEDLAAAALLAILLADRQQDTPAAAAIRSYLLIQALSEL